MIKKLILIIALWSNIVLSENNENQKHNQFNHFFNTLNSLKANFSQSVYTAGDILLSETSGNLVFQRPQQLRWNTDQPKQTLLLNNNQLWMVDIDLEQAVLQKSQDFSKTPLYWLINKPNTLKNTPKYAYSEGGIDWYLANQSTQPLKFGFVNGILNTISLENELDQVIFITFDTIEINPNINQKAFELNLDPDFDIIK